MRLLLFIAFIYCPLFISTAIAETLTFECSYPQSHSLQDGLVKNQEFELTFIVDLETEKAYVVGNQGSEPVHIVPGNNKVTFIEITGTNNVITTTVIIETLSGTDVGDSVHSRNVVIIDELVASQMYGKCAIS